MENISVNNEINGDIKISDEVIATIASVATKEIKGISGLSLSFTDEITSKFTKKSSGTAIKISFDNDKAIIDISIVVKYGVRIPEISWDVQENVKKAVESMTGITVSKVNIIVANVDFSEKSKITKNEKEE